MMDENRMQPAAAESGVAKTCPKHNIIMVEMGDETASQWYCPECQVDEEKEHARENEPDEWDEPPTYEPPVAQAAANAGGPGAAGFWTELHALLAKYGENTEDHAARIGTEGDIDGSISIERRYTDGLRAIYLMALHVEKQQTALAEAQARADGLREENTTLKKQLKSLRRKSNLDEGFIDVLTEKDGE